MDCSGFTAHFTVSFGRSQIIWIYTLRDHKWKYDSGVSGGECRVCQWCEPEELEAGDDISFYMTEDVVATHRIGGVDKAGKCVTTYGVNNLDSEGNQINDAKAVDFDYIIGRVEYSIPIVGYVYMLIRRRRERQV